MLAEIRALATEPVNIMEVCGTHTMAIAKAGIKRMLPETVRLISGPGCPVCVTPPEVIDAYLALSEDPRVIISCYGDMLKVPGSRRGDNLLRRRALGARVEIVFSPMDALDIAAAHSDKEVIFLGAGFETTAPGTAVAVGQAVERGLKNMSFLMMLKTVEPALRALAADPDFNVQGLLCPGHVATIIGEKGFAYVPRDLGLASCIGGFEPEDILLAVRSILRQIAEKSPSVDNEYKRAVRPEGNPIAMKIIDTYLQPVDEIWRGLGTIPASGLGIREEFAAYDAQKKFGITYSEKPLTNGCLCGEIICGKKEPAMCPLFGRVCTPEDPVGPCMVSSEGACAAAYKYGDF